MGNRALIFLCSAFLALVAPSVSAQEGERRQMMARFENGTVTLTANEDRVVGLLLNEKGLVLTNSLVARLPETYQARIGSTSEAFEAKVVALHPEWELALVQIESRFEKIKVKVAPLATATPAIDELLYLCGWREEAQQVKVVNATTSPYRPEFFHAPNVTVPAPKCGDIAFNLRGEAAGMVTRTIVNGKLDTRCIPLSRVKIQDFVAPGKRRSDFVRAREMIKLAEQAVGATFWDVAPGFNNRDAAIEYLRMALAEDPNNPEIYFFIGKAKVRSGQDSQGVTYLAQAFRIDPWAEFTPHVLYELGLGLSGLHRSEDAAIIWTETITRFPSQLAAPTAWEALADAHFSAGRFAEAARHSWAALDMPRCRTDAMRDIYSRSKLRLTAAGLKAQDEFEGGLVELRRKMTQEAEKAKQESRVFITPAAERVFKSLKEMGGGAFGPFAKSPPVETPKPLSDDEVTRLFIQSRLSVALEHVKSGSYSLAEGIVEDVIKAYPNHVETATARKLLEIIKKKK